MFYNKEVKSEFIIFIPTSLALANSIVTQLKIFAAIKKVPSPFVLPFSFFFVLPPPPAPPAMPQNKNTEAIFKFFYFMCKGFQFQLHAKRN